MLVEFSVENYRSFKEKMTLSMIASEDKSHEEQNVITLNDGTRLLKSAIIYGANASGKSNLILAMERLAGFVFGSPERKPDEKINVEPYLLDEVSKGMPTHFEVILYSDGVKYAYGVILSSEKVFEEYLYRFEGKKQRIVFERFETDQYNFIDDFEPNPKAAVLDHLKDFTTPNKSYLSNAVMFNYKELESFYYTLLNLFQFSNADTYNLLRSAYFTENGKTESMKHTLRTVTNWVKQIDVGISDIRIKESKELFKDDYFNNGKFNHENHVKMLHHIIAEHKTESGGIAEFNLYANVSDGTRGFFMLGLAIADKFSRGGFFVKDELGNDLHTLLLKHLIQMFHGAENKLNSQLIFTEHDTNVLDLDIFRRDQIWFVEKNPDTKESDLFSLWDFGDKNDINVEKGYLLGTYGAIPFLKGLTSDGDQS